MGVADIVLRHGCQMVLKLVFGNRNMMVFHVVTWQDRLGIVQTFIRNGNQMLVRCIIADAHHILICVFFGDTNKVIFK